MLTAPTSLPVAPALPSALAFEQIIGEIAAGAALAIARALCEFQRDGLSARETRMHAGTQIARLWELLPTLLPAAQQVPTLPPVCTQPPDLGTTSSQRPLFTRAFC